MKNSNSNSVSLAVYERGGDFIMVAPAESQYGGWISQRFNEPIIITWHVICGVMSYFDKFINPDRAFRSDLQMFLWNNLGREVIMEKI